MISARRPAVRPIFSPVGVRGAAAGFGGAGFAADGSRVGWGPGAGGVVGAVAEFLLPAVVHVESCLDSRFPRGGS